MNKEDMFGYAMFGIMAILVLVVVYEVAVISKSCGFHKPKYELYEKMELVTLDSRTDVLGEGGGSFIGASYAERVDSTFKFYVKKENGDIKLLTIPADNVTIRITDKTPYCVTEAMRGENILGEVHWWISKTNPILYTLYVPENSIIHKIQLNN